MKDGKHTHPNGTQVWYKKDELHRTDGPAITHANGTQEWWQNDKLHRTDGPAITYPDGYEAWYQNGKRLTESEVLILKEGIEFDKMMREMLTEEIV